MWCNVHELCRTPHLSLAAAAAAEAVGCCWTANSITMYSVRCTKQGVQGVMDAPNVVRAVEGVFLPGRQYVLRQRIRGAAGLPCEDWLCSEWYSRTKKLSCATTTTTTSELE